MSDLQELYQSLIIDHSRSPKNFGKLEEPTAQNRGLNPICGDDVTLFLIEKDGVIEDIKFTGVGCAISMASVSLMTEAVKGKNLQEVEILFQGVHHLMTGKASSDEVELGKLIALGGVSAYPMRVKCATLGWHTLRAALQQQNETVCTES